MNVIFMDGFELYPTGLAGNHDPSVTPNFEVLKRWNGAASLAKIPSDMSGLYVTKGRHGGHALVMNPSDVDRSYITSKQLPLYNECTIGYDYKAEGNFDPQPSVVWYIDGSNYITACLNNTSCQIRRNSNVLFFNSGLNIDVTKWNYIELNYLYKAVDNDEVVLFLNGDPVCSGVAAIAASQGPYLLEPGSYYTDGYAAYDNLYFAHVTGVQKNFGMVDMKYYRPLTEVITDSSYVGDSSVSAVSGVTEADYLESQLTDINLYNHDGVSPRPDIKAVTFHSHIYKAHSTGGDVNPVIRRDGIIHECVGTVSGQPVVLDTWSQREFVCNTTPSGTQWSTTDILLPFGISGST